MWQKFSLKNFRGFKDIVLAPLSRVNLIAGKNNTGKTAILEGIHLHSFPQQCFLPFKISEYRSSTPDFQAPAAPLNFDMDSVRWLAYDKNTDPSIELTSVDEKGVTRVLSIWIGDAKASREKFPGLSTRFNEPVSQQYWENSQPRIILDASIGGEHYYGAAFQATIGTLGGMGFGGLAPWDGPSIFLGSAGRSQEEDAKVFSNLDAANRQEEVLTSLRVLEPRLQRLSILFLGEKPVIHGTIGLSRPVPIGFMGEGIRRLLSILLAISTARGGNVLIDEIENGLHYSVLKDVWKAVGHAAREADVQVFATTHNWECIHWAHEAFAESGHYDFRLHRLDRIWGQVSVVSFDRELIESALGNAVEMR